MNEKIVFISVILAFIVLIIGGLAIVNFAGDELYYRFKKLENKFSAITPVDFFNNVNHSYFNYQLRLKTKQGILVDNFASNGVLTLSTNYAFVSSFPGVVICAHELGHAFQYKNNREKMIKHAKKIKLSKTLSWFVSPLLIASVVLVFLKYWYIAISTFALSILIFIIAVSVKLNTIKVEKEASDTALKLLEEFSYFNDEEMKEAKKFLNSAKLTYVADLLKIMLKWTMLTKK